METYANHDIMLFENVADWGNWLATNYERNKGLWLKISKKGATYASISYAEALDEALCYGWIDGQKASYDEQYYLQKFTQRRSKSIWSKANVDHVERLIATGRMQPPGQAAVTVAQVDGRWERAYEGSRTIKITPDFANALTASPKAKTFYDSLDRANVYAILFRLHNTVNPEARRQKVNQYIVMLERGEKLH